MLNTMCMCIACKYDTLEKIIFVMIQRLDFYIYLNWDSSESIIHMQYHTRVIKITLIVV